MAPKPVKKTKATNVKAEVQEEEEVYLSYTKNYYGDVHYHVYDGGILIEQSGNPPPPPPYGGG